MGVGLKSERQRESVDAGERAREGWSECSQYQCADHDVWRLRVLTVERATLGGAGGGFRGVRQRWVALPAPLWNQSRVLQH
eukprot:3694843-Rhodomonas_salina.2